MPKRCACVRPGSAGQSEGLARTTCSSACVQAMCNHVTRHGVQVLEGKEKGHDETLTAAAFNARVPLGLVLSRSP